ncbi:hypothetical protein BVRB_1g007730 [Beta vulgaris subsp. vulgaris]|nr:hypothetical protein BVRB_1g007730 [Beta vulgaris subsp. vulgaris]
MAASDDPFVGWATLRFWHGGNFKEVNNRLKYVGGQGKTKRIDLDELSWFTLKVMVEECGGYKDNSEILYLMPNCSLDDGLKKVYNDDECLEMGKLLMKSRSLDLYVVHGVDTPNVLHKLPEVIFDGHYVPVPKSPKKLIPRRQPKNILIDKPSESLSVVQRIQEVEVTPPKKVKQSTKQKVTSPLRSSPRFNKSCTNPHTIVISTTTQPPNPHDKGNCQPSETLAPEIEESSSKAPKENCQPSETLPEDYHDFYDDRPESHIPYAELLGGQSDSSNSNPGYAPDESTDSSESDGDGFVVDEELIEGEQSEREVIVENIEQADSDDDELRETRQRVKLRNAELINIAEKLRRQIDEGTFGSVKPTDGTEGRSDSSRREGDEACITPVFDIRLGKNVVELNHSTHRLLLQEMSANNSPSLFPN